MRKDIVALILEENGKILVERRKTTKSTTPGTVIFPAGHVEENESKEDALKREIKEELCIEIEKLQLIYQADFNCEEQQRIFWYGCERYRGSIQCREAEKLFWIDPSQSYLLTHQVSRDALAVFKKRKAKK